jgi:hypothetical protein
VQRATGLDDDALMAAGGAEGGLPVRPDRQARAATARLDPIVVVAGTQRPNDLVEQPLVEAPDPAQRVGDDGGLPAVARRRRQVQPITPTAAIDDVAVGLHVDIGATLVGSLHDRDEARAAGATASSVVDHADHIASGDAVDEDDAVFAAAQALASRDQALDGQRRDGRRITVADVPRPASAHD